MNAILILCLWLLCCPLGYVACRWVSKSLGLAKWTHMDRLGAILFSALYGPLTPVIAVVLVLFQKLSDTEWANRDARW